MATRPCGAQQIGVGLKRGMMGMSNVLTADPRIPRTKPSSVDVDVRTVKDWTDWSTSSKDSVALCEIWLGEQGKPIYSSRSKADPHKRWASSPNDLALCGKWSEMLSCGSIYWLQTVLHIPQRKGCWLGNKKKFWYKTNKYLIARFQLQSFSQCLDGFAIFTLQGQNLG